MNHIENKILVTGGTGLLGSHLLLSLTLEGKRPRATYRSESSLEFTKKVFRYYAAEADELFRNIEWVRADILDRSSVKDAVSGCGQVYHCAASVSFDKAKSEETIKTNSEGTASVVEACLSAGEIRLCHVSSVAALGARGGEKKTDETHEWVTSSRNSAYGISKYLSEQEVWMGIKEGLDAVIVNPSIILGPGEWNRGSSQFFSRIADGMRFCTEGMTGYVDVRDVVKAMILLMNSGISGERYIISSENLSYSQLFRMIANAMGIRRRFISVPKILSYPARWILALAGPVSGNSMTQIAGAMKAAFSQVSFDNSKIISHTGMSFIPMQQSVDETVKLYLNDREHKS